MESLQGIIGSNLFNEDLYTDNRLKFFFQIEPAIHYSLENTIKELLEDDQIEQEYFELDNKGLLEVIKENELLDEILREKLSELISKINEVRKIPIMRALGTDEKLEETENILNNADDVLDETRSIVKDIVIYYAE